MADAHSRNDRGERHDLVAHLRAVSELAAQFADAFGAAELGRLAGLYHDLGKFHPAFQRYLVACEAEPAVRRHGPDHKAAGACLAAQRFWGLALLIQAHHGGLQAPVALKSWLAERQCDPAVGEALRLARQALPELDQPGELPIPPAVRCSRTAAELWLRLSFSALVDADYLDTERHFRPELAAQRGTSVTLAELWQRFEADQARVTGWRDDTVGRARDEIYRACLAAAEQPPGLFRLTVPTGGGKTRSAMAFALRHALRHGQQRIVVAVPYLTITEQTADVYRGIFEAGGDGQTIVLEHHSAAWSKESDGEDFRQEAVWQRLAAENWDAPIIVTTTVQLFESLFSSSPSACRKLHRLARSVIILDEAQTLPPHLLRPILDALRQLCQHYGVTVVLSTATQPAFEAIDLFADLPATEIVPEPGRFFAALRRVTYEWRTAERLSWDEAAALLRSERQALAIVNTKRDALALLDALDDAAALHLSTLLCGAHRRHVLARVRQRLAEGAPCRVVATQVVEAGVDIDFPMVLRAAGPLDSLIQAAGRCNREGRLPRGRVVVFEPAEGGLPAGAYKTGTGVTRALLGRATFDLDDPLVARQYFQQLFQTLDTDREHIQSLREQMNYPEVAQRFRMIDDETESIAITAYGTEKERRRVRAWLDHLRVGAADARLLRRQLQPYLVSVRRGPAETCRRRGLIAPVAPGLGEWLGQYDDVRGLIERDVSPETLVV